MATAAIACSEDDAIDPAAAGSAGEAINREVLLDSVDDVRAMIDDNAASLDPMLITSVDYADGRLSVVLAESQNDVSPADLDSICREISSSIAVPDMTIVVEKAAGTETAECSFGG